MFDIGFSELFFIAIVALIVLGPERLPKAARFVGLWVRRGRAQWHSVKSELERELAAEELKRSLHEAEGAMREVDDSMRGIGDGVRREVEAVRDSVRKTAREIEADTGQHDALTDTSTDDDARDHGDPAADTPGEFPAVEPPAAEPPAAETDAPAPAPDPDDAPRRP